MIGICLAACTGHNRFDERMAAADSILISRPDSAYRMLCAMEALADSQTLARQMRYQLLRANAQNKAYVPFTSDSIGRLLTEYFDDNGLANERMLAYYIKGCTYRDLEDIPAALQAFNAAAAEADTLSPECDFYHLGVIYAQIGGIFRKRGLPDEAIQAYEAAERCAWKNQDTTSVLSFWANKSNALLTKGETDVAIGLKEKTAALYSQLGLVRKAAQTRVQLIKLYARKGDFDKARAAMEEYEAQSGHFTAQGEIRAGKEDYYHIKGTYYLEKGDADSAEHYFRELARKGRTLNDRYLSSWGMTRIFMQSHQPDSLAKYALQTFFSSDSLYNMEAAKNLQNAQAMYNYLRYREMAQHAAQETAETRLHARYGLMLGALFFLMLVFMVLYLRKKANLKEHESQSLRAELLRTINAWQNTKDELDCLALEKQEVEEQLTRDTERKRRIEAVMEHKERQIAQLQENVFSLEQRFKMQSQGMNLDNSEIVRHLKQIRKNPLLCVPTEEDWDKLRAEIEVHFPSFYMRMHGGKRINETEYRVCLLVKAGFSASDIDVLLERKEYAATTRKRLLKKVFDKEGSARDFDDMVLNFDTAC